jgi:hypothetical protein
MFLAGEFPHKIEAVSCWVWRGFHGFGLWEVKMLRVQVMGETLVNCVLTPRNYWPPNVNLRTFKNAFVWPQFGNVVCARGNACRNIIYRRILDYCAAPPCIPAFLELFK